MNNNIYTFGTPVQIDIGYKFPEVDFLLHRIDDIYYQAYMYTYFKSNNIYIYDNVSKNQRNGYATLLFDTLLKTIPDFYINNECKYINGWLSEKDRKDGNWEKSIPFYQKMFDRHSKKISNFYFYNYHDETQHFAPEYILNNLSKFENIRLYFKYIIHHT